MKHRPYSKSTLHGQYSMNTIHTKTLSTPYSNEFINDDKTKLKYHIIR